MKITVSINIGGMAFHIDEDAYTELKVYLRSLDRYFARESSSAEIMSDIEARIADLLKARINDYKQVITIEDVREVISILGTPEDIHDDSGAGQESPAAQHTGGCIVIRTTGLLQVYARAWPPTGGWTPGL
ncbi:MAG: hypothetical protein U5K32_07595 [Bacteroidales bacterium]|nr:hypothetical protein [Bacteroidales bacterium]